MRRYANSPTVDVGVRCTGSSILQVSKAPVPALVCIPDACKRAFQEASLMGFKPWTTSRPSEHAELGNGFLKVMPSVSTCTSKFTRKGRLRILNVNRVNWLQQHVGLMKTPENVVQHVKKEAVFPPGMTEMARAH